MLQISFHVYYNESPMYAFTIIFTCGTTSWKKSTTLATTDLSLEKTEKIKNTSKLTLSKCQNLLDLNVLNCTYEL